MLLTLPTGGEAGGLTKEGRNFLKKEKQRAKNLLLFSYMEGVYSEEIQSVSESVRSITVSRFQLISSVI